MAEQPEKRRIVHRLRSPKTKIKHDIAPSEVNPIQIAPNDPLPTGSRFHHAKRHIFDEDGILGLHNSCKNDEKLLPSVPASKVITVIQNNIEGAVIQRELSFLCYFCTVALIKKYDL